MTQQPSTRAQFWNRVQLIMIMVVFAAPIVGAYLYKPTRFMNYGDLHTPVQPVASITMSDGQDATTFDDLKGHWIFLVLARDDCAQACEDNILKIRQLRFMQNNDMSRIRTVFLSTGVRPAVSEDLAAKYRPMEVYTANQDDFTRFFNSLSLAGAPEAANRDRFYIIDPAGNLIISYPSNADPSYIKKDIKRLLQTS